MKVIIIPACTDLNRGDQALVWEAAKLAQDAYENCDVNIVDYGINDNDRKRQSKQTLDKGYKVIRNLVEHPKRVIKNSKEKIHSSSIDLIMICAVAILDFIKNLLILIFPYERFVNLILTAPKLRESFNIMKTSNLIMVKGGGFIHTYGKLGDLYYLWFNLYYVILAKRLNKKIVILPNSFGPIKGSLCSKFVKWVVSISNFVYVREQVSGQVLANIGYKKSRFSYDLGYYIKPSQKFSSIEKEDILKKIINNNAKKIAITVRPYRFPKSFNPENAYNNYINSIVDFCNELQGYDFYFIVQVQGPSAHENDILAIHDVVSKLKIKNWEIIDSDFDYEEITSIYSKMDFIIGTRFHSIIFSHVVNVPGIAIAYGGNKTRGIMRELDLEGYVIDIEFSNKNDLLAMFKSLETNKELYIDKLKKAKTDIYQERKNIVNDLKTLS